MTTEHVSSVLVAGRCHYCRRKSETEDHIVPQSLLPRPLSRLPYWFRQHFTVPSCKACNGGKADFRSDCNCEQCVWVWNVALATWVDPSLEPETVSVAEKRLELLRKQKRNRRRREGLQPRRSVV